MKKFILILALTAPVLGYSDDVKREELEESDRILMQELKESRAQLGGFDFSAIVETTDKEKEKRPEQPQGRRFGPQE